MPLEYTSNQRQERSALNEEEEQEENGAFDFTSFFQSSPFGFDGGEDDNSTVELDFDEFPSSNDTELLISRPSVVNLGSRSSKCIQVAIY